MKKIAFILSLIFMMVLSIPLCGFADNNEIIIHVSPDGSDRNKGTSEEPLASLNGARVRLRNIDHSKKKVTVLFHAGEYSMDKGVFFDSRDSGNEKAPVEYKAAGDGEVIFNGSKILDVTKFTSITDKAIQNRLPKQSRQYVGQLDLAKQGLTYEMVDMTSKLSVGQTAKVLGIFLNGKKQSLARWPNFGYNLFGNVLNGGGMARYSENKGLGAVFEYDQINPERWTQAEDAYIEGYFGVEFAAEWAKIGSIDTKKHTITLNDWTQYGVRTAHRWAAVNLLEEIDIPGEWYIDKANMILYYYPSYVLSNSDKLEVAVLNDPFVTIDGAEYITFSNIHFKNSREKGIVLKNTSNIHIIDSTVENIGDIGIEVYGKNILIKGCQIYETGGAAIILLGGSDLQAQTPCNIRVENNHIYHFNLNGSFDSPYAIVVGRIISGGSIVGATVENNIIHGGWDASGIQYGGNDNIIRYNEIYNVVRNVADAGVIYAGRRLNEYGNEIKYNYLHDFGAMFDAAFSTCGIYWDDWQSGQLAQNNIIVGTGKNNTRGNILVGADNTYQYNVIVNLATGLSLADRDKYNYTISNNTGLKTAYDSIANSSATLQTKYPRAAALKSSIDKEGRFFVSGNLITDNISAVVKANNIDDTFYKYSTVENNQIVDSYDIFVDPENHDYRIKREAMEEYNFAPQMLNEDNFDMDSIGIQKDVYDIQKPDTPFYQLYPRNGQQQVSSQSLMLLWEKALFADEYEYVIATDPELKNVVKSGITIENHVDFEEVENGKSYYWKVKAKNKSKQIANEWDSEGDPYVFTVSQYDDLNKTFLKEAIEKAEASISDISEDGEGVGLYKKGTTDKFISKIEEAKQVYSITVGKQSDIDIATEKMKKAIDSLKGSRYLGHANLHVGNASNWKEDISGNIVYADEGNAVKMSKKDAGVSALDGKVSNYEVQHFKMKLDYDGWAGIALRQTNPNAISYSSVDSSYLIVIKEDIFELQKYKPGAPVTGILTTAVNNGIISDGQWCDIEFGAVNVDSGVELLFKVNGKVIFDYYDNEVPIHDEGYFVVIPPNSNGAISIAPADSIPEGYYEPSDSLFEKNEADEVGDVFDETSKEYSKQGSWAESEITGYGDKKVLVSGDVQAKAVYNLARARESYKIYYYHSSIEDGDKNASILCRYTDGNSGTKDYIKKVNFSDGESGWKEIGVFEFTSANASSGNIDIEISGSGNGKIVSAPIKLVKANNSQLKFSQLFYRENENLMALKIGKDIAYKDGVKVEIPDTTPIIENQYTMVPLRFVSEAFDGQVQWNQQDSSVILNIGENTIIFALNKSSMNINGEETAIEQMPILRDGRVLVPLRAIAEALGKKVVWEGKRKLIFIGDNLFGVSGLEDSVMDLVDKAFEGGF